MRGACLSPPAPVFCEFAARQVAGKVRPVFGGEKGWECKQGCSRGTRMAKQALVFAGASKDVLGKAYQVIAYGCLDDIYHPESGHLAFHPPQPATLD